MGRLWQRLHLAFKCQHSVKEGNLVLPTEWIM